MAALAIRPLAWCLQIASGIGEYINLRQYDFHLEKKKEVVIEFKMSRLCSVSFRPCPPSYDALADSDIVLLFDKSIVNVQILVSDVAHAVFGAKHLECRLKHLQCRADTSICHNKNSALSD